MAQEELNSMMRFILSKEHMKIKFLHIELSNVSTRESNGGRFKHTIGLKFFVKTSNLWETLAHRSGRGIILNGQFGQVFARTVLASFS